MDASAIITQVARDDDRHNNHQQQQQQQQQQQSQQNHHQTQTQRNSRGKGACPCPCPPCPACPTDSGGNSDHNDSEASACVGLGNTSKKSGSSGFLRSLLCCWGGGGGRGKGPPSTTTDGAPSSPLVLTTDPSRWLLPPVRHQDMHKKCMVIDLDETLVHSSFKPINNADFVVPVEIDGTVHQVYVLKRPHVDEFLRRAGELYECVLFTASLAKYADPVADLLDKWGVFRARLFRESCVIHHGNYVKDLNKLGRDLRRVVIVDNSPASYIFHPDNAVPVASWFDDMTDSELLNLIPFFEKLSKVDSVYTVLCNSNRPYNGPGTPRGSSPS